jgi:2-methylisocitrate lyase-like PEP mutase family enzyme
MGFSIVFYALSTLFTAVKAIEGTLGALKRDGTPKNRADHMVTYAQFSEVTGLAAYDALDDQFGWPEHK